MVDLQETLDALSVSNRILGYVNAPSLMQKAVARCVDDTSDLAVYAENKKIIWKAVLYMEKNIRSGTNI